LRAIYSIDNKLSIGLGVDIAIAPLQLNGILPLYAIIGYNNIYLHCGYDFGIGSLYIAPSFLINKNFMIGIPFGLLGSNQRVCIASYIFPPKRDEHTFIYYDYSFIGVSFQYIF